jgi:ectoine hydroxylase-related dioxygenase (phytanoyl-CoA dioxygenase family)
MDEMRDSTSFATSPARLREEIATYGYLLIRGLVDPDAASAAGEQVRKIMAEHEWTGPSASGERVLRVPVKGAEPDDYWAMYSAVLGNEAVNALAWQPRLRESVRSLLGPTAYTYPMKTVRLVFPSELGGTAIPVHRDNRGGPWVRDMFTTWVALGHIDAALGGFALLSGSQTYRYEAIREPGAAPRGGPRGLPIPGDDSPEWVSTEFQPGDVVIFHCYTVHRGLPNHADRVRLSVDYRWQTTEHPVHVSSLLPYHYFDKYPRIPGWQELSAGWSDQAWCSYPASAQVCYEKWPGGADDLVPRSDFVTVPPGTREAWRPETREAAIFRLPHEVPPTYREHPLEPARRA